MVLPSQRFCKGIDNLEWQFVEMLSHVVKLYRIQLVNSLKITLATIIYSVAEILVIFHISKINWFVVREIDSLCLGCAIKYSPRTLCRFRSSNLLVPTALLVPIRRLPDTHTPCKEY